MMQIAAVKEVLKPGFYIALGALLLAFFVVQLGAYTRLVDAGLGCPDWPFCYGFIFAPESADELQVAKQEYPDSPVDKFKASVELGHRYFAGFLGLMVFYLGYIAWRNRRLRGYPVKLVALLGVLILWQAAFGAWTVTLKLWPQVVVAHLLGGLAMLSLLLLLVLRLGNTTIGVFRLWPASHSRSLLILWLGGLSLLLLVIQIFFGGWVSANYAAIACPDFPTCQGQWWPQADYATGLSLLNTGGEDYLGGVMHNDARVAVHFVHRLGAVILSIFLLCGGCFYWYCKIYWSWLIAVWGFLGLQVGIGIANIYLQLPLYLALTHNTGAVILLLVLVALNYFIHKQRQSVRQKDSNFIGSNGSRKDTSKIL